jgi:pyruvate dehydrogenase E1 component alpha subunit
VETVKVVDLKDQSIISQSPPIASAELLVSMHRAMLRIRHTEEIIASRYSRQQMRTPTHLGTGQEAVAVGVITAMSEGDVAYSHHRGHNHYMACGGSIEALAAEIHGRETGCSHGRGGSVHLTARDKGFIISSAILGETVAVATGSGLAFAMDGVPRAAVAFFGEAACEEGIVYECLNYAAIQSLPVVYVCENNLYSTETPLYKRQPRDTELTERARSFKVNVAKVDGNDVNAVYQTAKQAFARARSGGGPTFMECMTYRWHEHVGPLLDHESDRVYRTKEEFDSWLLRCPVKRSAERLTQLGLADEATLESWSKETSAQIFEIFQQVEDEPWPETTALFDNV